MDPQENLAVQLGEFTVNINVTDASNLQAVTFELSYNTTLLDITGITEGPFMKQFGNTFFSTVRNESRGYLQVAVGNLGGYGPASGDGTLATITFNATYSGSAWCTLDLCNTTLYNPSVEPIPHEVIDGYYEFVILGLNVMTNKQLYEGNEFVTIHGNLTTCRAGGLVALEVQDPRYVRVLRTLQTSTNPPVGNITITEMYPCDFAGNPKYSFPADRSAYVKVTVKNNGDTSKNVTITVNAYDSSLRPFGAPVATLSLNPGATAFIIPPIFIPTWASSGTATAYASVFTDMPSRGGTAYCSEKSAQFEITGGSTPIPGEPEPTGIVSNYNLSFRLPPEVVEGWYMEGWYMVYVGSSHQSLRATNKTTFGVPPCPPLPSFTYTPPTPSINQVVTFDASTSKPGHNGIYYVPIANYTWNFGDEDTTTTTEPTVTHQYATNDTYTVTLTAMCEDDPVLIAKGLTTNSAQQSVKIYQLPYGPKADFTYTPPCPGINQVVTFDASTSQPGWNITVQPLIRYEWDFGDGNVNVTTAPTITHEYTVEGVYNVTLNVTDTQGLWNITSKATPVYTLAMTNFTVTLPYGASALHPGWGAYPEEWRQIRINVTVENRGAENANFTVTTYYNDQLIHDYYGNDTQTVTNLAPGENVTLTFRWDTTGVFPQYTRNIYVNIPNPRGDIKWQGSTVTVRRRGDASGDGHCDGYDFTILNLSWLQRKGDPYFDPRADFNGDGAVDGFDFTTLNLNWLTF